MFDIVRRWNSAFQEDRLILLARLPRRRLRPEAVAAAINTALGGVSPVILRAATSGRIGDDRVLLAVAADGSVCGKIGRQVLLAPPEGAPGVGRPAKVPSHRAIRPRY